MAVAGRRWLTPLLLLTLVVWLVQGAVWRVEQNEQGVVLRLGRVARLLGPGMHFTLPWPLERVEGVPTTELRTMPVGFNMIEKAQGLPPRSDEVEWLTGDTNIVELQATVLYTITDPVEYLYGVSAEQDGTSRLFLIRKVTESVLSRLIAGMTIDSILAEGQSVLKRVAARESQDLLDELGLGVTIQGINLIEISPPQSVKEFFNDYTSARQDRERLKLEAEGSAARSLPRARARANEILEEARTRASEVVSRARGEAERFKGLAAETARAPALTRRRLWLDSMARILATARKRVVPPGTEDAPTRVYLEAE